MLEAFAQFPEQLRQGHGVVHAGRQAGGLFFDHLAALDQAALRHLPQSRQNQPVLDQHAQQLGVHLAQHMVRIGAARMPQPAAAFPEFEQQFDLPAIRPP